MNLLNKFNVHESSEFHKKGYFILKNSFDQSEIKRAQNSFFEIKRNAKKGSYPFIRVYDDYSALRNLSGIEMTFNEQILSQEIFNFIEKSRLLEITKSMIGDNLELELSRYHVTENFTHVGNWHRDNQISSQMDTIQANLYLFDEKGMQILDNSHNKEVEDEQEIKRTPHLSLKNSKWIETKAGDLLFFNPSILHRGISLKPRANIPILDLEN